MDYGQIKIVYIFRKKDINYSEIEWFEIDNIMNTINLKIIGRRAPINFFYSDDELEEVRRIFGKYRVKRRSKGGKKGEEINKPQNP
jgi:hypothetical protein